MASFLRLDLVCCARVLRYGSSFFSSSASFNQVGTTRSPLLNLSSYTIGLARKLTSFSSQLKTKALALLSFDSAFEMSLSSLFLRFLFSLQRPTNWMEERWSSFQVLRHLMWWILALRTRRFSAYLCLTIFLAYVLVIFCTILWLTLN